MTPEQFCYWLQGFCELNGSLPSDEQWKSINEHLQLVFNKQTKITIGPAVAAPARGPLTPFQFDKSLVTC